MVDHEVAELEVDLQSNTQSGMRRSERNKHRAVIERSHQSSLQARSQPTIDKPHNAQRRETHGVYRSQTTQDFQTLDRRSGFRLALHFRHDNWNDNGRSENPQRAHHAARNHPFRHNSDHGKLRRASMQECALEGALRTGETRRWAGRACAYH